jgi:DNA sulfur modification protein DndD
LTVLVGKIEYETLSDGEVMMKMAMFADDKIPSGCEILPNETSFKIKKKSRNESEFHDIEDDYNTLMTQILPRDLSIFFLLDGEFLEKFWDNFDKVELGIEQISQLHLLSSAIQHVDDMNVKRINLNDGSEEDLLHKKIERNKYYEKSLDEDGNIYYSEKPRWVQKGHEQSEEFYHATGLPRINDLEHDTKKMERRSKEISREIGNINVASAKLLQEEFDKTENELQQAKARRITYENNYRDNLINKSPYLFLKGAIEKSVKIIEHHLKQGDLPNETKKTFTSDLLERGFCICQTDLKSKIVDGKEINNARVKVEEARAAISEDVGLDGAVKMRYSFKDKVLDEYNTFLEKTFGNPRKEFRESKKEEDDLNRKLKGIKEQLGTSGDSKIQELINEQDQVIEDIKSATEKTNEIKVQLAKNADETDAYKQKLIKLSAKNTRAKKTNHEMQIWDAAKKQLTEIYDELKDEIRINMQNKTWEIFTQILYESNKFKKFEIRKDYSVILLNQQNQNHILDLSAGQSLFLAISFVTALREITGYKFPLIIDTPLGKISGSNAYNLAKVLPSYLDGQQISFLATDKEWVGNIPNISDNKRPTSPFVELLQEQIPVHHYRIKQGKDWNSSIYPAKYENGELIIVRS